MASVSHRPTAATPSVRERAAGIRLAAFDVDGTLTDGGLVYADDGSECKVFSVHDGLGLKLLREFGIEVALITARNSPMVTRRAADLGIDLLLQGCRDKGTALSEMCAQLGLETSAACFMGDDLADLPALQLAGLSVAPANAVGWIRERVHLVTALRGGDGAVRELCELLLDAQGHSADLLARYGG